MAVWISFGFLVLSHLGGNGKLKLLRNYLFPIEEEWSDITNIIKQAALESLGTKKWHRKKGLRKWDDEIAKIIKINKKLS